MEGNETIVKEKNEESVEIEETFKKMEGKPKKSWKKIIIIASVLIILAIFISLIFALININNSNIISGVSIENIDMSGLSKEEAKGKLEIIYNEKLQKEISVKYQDYESEINPTILETNYKIDDAVEEAFLIGRSSNILVNNYNILFTRVSFL